MMLRLLLTVLSLFVGAVAGNHHRSVDVTSPQPYEVWDGRVRGIAPLGTRSVEAVFGGRRWSVPVRVDGSFDTRLDGATTGDGRLRVGTAQVSPVYAVPSGSLRRLEPRRNDAQLDAAIAQRARDSTLHVSAELWRADGTAASYNAGAEFEAASTLKLPAMLTALAGLHGELRRSSYWEPFEAITRYSDNAAADQVLDLLGGSEPGGAARMVSFVRSLGLQHTFMEGGYLTAAGAGGGPPPARVDDPPPSAYKYTTADDMARLAGALADAAAGGGPLARRGVSTHEARELLYLMLHAEDSGLVKPGAGSLPVAHKIGWLDDSRDDVAVVFTRHGPVVVTVYTYGDIDQSAYRFGAAVARLAIRGG